MIRHVNNFTRRQLEFRLDFLYEARHRLFWTIEALEQLHRNVEQEQKLENLRVVSKEIERDINHYYQAQLVSIKLPIFSQPSSTPSFYRS